jgi:lantibiotic biosynthesis protein
VAAVLNVTPSVTRVATLPAALVPRLFAAADEGGEAMSELVRTDALCRSVIAVSQPRCLAKIIRDEPLGRRDVDAVLRSLLRAAGRPTPSGLAGAIGNLLAHDAQLAASSTTVAVATSASKIVEWFARLEDELPDAVRIARNPGVLAIGRCHYAIDGGPFADDRPRPPHGPGIELDERAEALLAAVGDMPTIGVAIERLSRSVSEFSRDESKQLIARLVAGGLILTECHPSPLDDLGAQLESILARMPDHPIAAEAAASSARCARLSGTSLDRFAGALGTAERAAGRDEARIDAFHSGELIGAEMMRRAGEYALLMSRSHSARKERVLRELFRRAYGEGACVPVLRFIADCGDARIDAGEDAVPPARVAALLRAMHDALRAGCREYRIGAEDLDAVLGPEPAGVRFDFELGVRFVRHPERGRLVTAPGFQPWTSGAGKSVGRYEYALGARGPEAIELAAEPAQPMWWAHVTRSRARRAIFSAPWNHVPGSVGLDALRVSLEAHGGPLTLRDRDGAPIAPLSEATLAHPRYRTRAMTIVERCAADGSCMIRPFGWRILGDAPFLPRLTYRDCIISPAMWRVDASQATGEDSVVRALDALGVPQTISAGYLDRQLPVDRDSRAGRRLLTRLLRRHGELRLSEIYVDAGWADGRVREAVFDVVASGSP